MSRIWASPHYWVLIMAFWLTPPLTYLDYKFWLSNQLPLHTIRPRLVTKRGHVYCHGNPLINRTTIYGVVKQGIMGFKRFSNIFVLNPRTAQMLKYFEEQSISSTKYRNRSYTRGTTLLITHIRNYWNCWWFCVMTSDPWLRSAGDYLLHFVPSFVMYSRQRYNMHALWR